MKIYKIVQMVCWSIVFVVFLGLAVWLLYRDNSKPISISAGNDNLTGSYVNSTTKDIQISVNDNLTGPYDEVGRYTVDASEIKNLQVSWASGSIIINPYEKDEITIIEYAQRELKEEEKIKIKTKNDTLEIDYCKANQIKNMPSKKLEVLLPVNTATNMKKIMIDKTSADLELRDIVATECDIESSSGNSKLLNLTLDNLNIDSTSGETNLDASVIKKLDISTSSGNVYLTELEVPDLKVNATSGMININNYAGENISIDTASGDIKLNQVTANNVEFKTASGFVYLNGSFSKLDADSSSGDYEIINHITPESFKISTASGNVSITMPEFENFDLSFDTASGDLECEIPMRKVSSSKYRIITTSGEAVIKRLK